MLKGFVSGGAWGSLLCGVSAFALTLATPLPAGNKPPRQPQTEIVATASDVQVAAPQDTAIAAVTTTTEILDVPQVVTPAVDEVATLTDTTPPVQPATAPVTPSLASPQPVVATQVTATSDAPVMPSPQSVAPQVPKAEADIVVSTRPAEPVTPPVSAIVPEATQVVVVDDIAAAPVPAAPVPTAPEPAAPEPAAAEPSVAKDVMVGSATVQTDAPAASDGEVPVIIADLEAVPVAPNTDRDNLAVPETAPAPDVAEVQPAPPAPEPDPAPEPVQDPLPQNPPAPAEEAVPAPAEEAAPAPAPEVIAVPAEVVAPPSTAANPPDGNATASAVTVFGGNGNAMPIGTSTVKVIRPGDNNSQVRDAPGVTQEPPATDENAAALTRFATPFENPDNKPMMSVVLIDDGSLDGAAAVLAEVPFPVTVVIDPARADANAAMARYRAAGIEVGILSGIPPGATPSDAEVNLTAAFDAVPEAVLLLDDGSGAVQKERDVMDQTIANLAAAGRGLVTVSHGLKTDLQTAAARQVPSAVVYSDLDSNGQDARVIRRFLDQAAFQARQTSGVVVLGRVRADTISALILFGTANRVGQVVMVPASAVLAAQ